ncbi:relaxase/mobilization nuclease domain-containing protein [Campylobacter sp. RM9344]|uniref:Relaxase/mobilization nuclease domain-containing protein n=1 Tax=Campylobacter californiensis TaxID=1032243 RepID=A0AAW3ZSB6_9BACT|nr:MULTISPECIES: relaxase/mobilization nuclease domain-containing protein [unclassified Campylobacter]MBE2985146.1 relaxase/mobilization nuclease domain-containing protein [Campylobacter sp. RM6883]MBE2986434.1 relaxase/mobilization nuclease domain-containing protein [Campylobacter sp. RM12919]MBE2987851.1 relaxase/mobilization nuclease domain-containing protein [Campylobacter sp. RM12920]MBE2995736.1 relaxase/mobilization nuclease domain-containing protein [Campylobacter sp. RM6913]MBE3029113
MNYICNEDKTDNEIYVTTHLCSRENAHKEFELTKKQFGSKTKTLAHHLIQSFVPEEVSFEEAHQVGIELCEKILGGKYEYVLATHIDKDHIHNHIIFNSIDVDEGKVYHSYCGSYMNIRNQSDRLCKEHNLSVIDQETQKEINEIRRRKYVNWYDWNEDKKGNSYKSRLQFDIDRTIKQSINWQDFLAKMENCGYKIKQGKHTAFRTKNQQRFTRTKTIGANYTEERIKERILNKDREIGNIVDIKNNDKAKSSRGYERWATKHNLQTAASTLVEIRNKGFNSMEELGRGISRISIEKNDLKREFDKLSLEQKRIKEVVKHIQICISKREHYEGYRKNPNDKIYMMMNRKDVEAYQKSYEEIDIFLKQFPHLRHIVVGELKTKSEKNLFRKLNEHSKELRAKQEEIAKKHNSLAAQYEELEHLKVNMNDYLGRDRTEKKKDSVICAIKKYKAEEKGNHKRKNKISKEAER